MFNLPVHALDTNVRVYKGTPSMRIRQQLTHTLNLKQRGPFESRLNIVCEISNMGVILEDIDAILS